jgi:hypothetical protein
LTAILVSGGVGGKELEDRKPAAARNAPEKPTEPATPTEQPRRSGTPTREPDAPARPPKPASQPSLSAEAARLSADLVKASADRQQNLLTQFSEGHGVVYTQALASAIPHLTGPTKAKARDALAERLARMTSATLRGRLHDEDREIRRAAALACAVKDDRNYVPDLITLLEDSETSVVLAAKAALKSLTDQDFGPAANAGRAERAQAIAAWKSWWDKQRSKQD